LRKPPLCSCVTAGAGRPGVSVGARPRIATSVENDVPECIVPMDDEGSACNDSAEGRDHLGHAPAQLPHLCAIDGVMAASAERVLP
jgi:hypothetical protein